MKILECNACFLEDGDCLRVGFPESRDRDKDLSVGSLFEKKSMECRGEGTW